MVTPVAAQKTNLGKSAFLIEGPPGLKKYKSQKSIRAVSTLAIFKPKGSINPGVIYLTVAKLTPNSKLVDSTARCALVVDFILKTNVK